MKDNRSQFSSTPTHSDIILCVKRTVPLIMLNTAHASFVLFQPFSVFFFSYWSCKRCMAAGPTGCHTCIFHNNSFMSIVKGRKLKKKKKLCRLNSCAALICVSRTCRLTGDHNISSSIVPGLCGQGKAYHTM